MIAFEKYHGTGNDFVMIDDRVGTFDIENIELIAHMCHRRFGVGADGLICLRNSTGYDFEMVYFNSDGRQSTMCGNGGRCLVKFAHSLGVFQDSCRFLAIDGPHEAIVHHDGSVKLKMSSVGNIFRDGLDYVLNTGSPHYVQIVKDVKSLDIKSKGAEIRYSDKYKKAGINVNFVELLKNELHVYTYERGVEDETYSCGTGVTASALISSLEFPQLEQPVQIQTKGGQLKVYFDHSNKQFENIWLEGPAQKVFSGRWPVL